MKESKQFAFETILKKSVLIRFFRKRKSETCLLSIVSLSKMRIKLNAVRFLNTDEFAPVFLLAVNCEKESVDLLPRFIESFSIIHESILTVFIDLARISFKSLMLPKLIFHGAKIVSALKTNNLKSVKKRHNFTNYVLH